MLFRIATESTVLKRVFYCNCMRYFSKKMLVEEKHLIDLDVRLKKNISELKKINSGIIIHKAEMELNLKNSIENQPDVLQHTRENSSSHCYQIQRSFTTGSNFALVKDNEIKDCRDQNIPESKVLVDTLPEISIKEPNKNNGIFDMSSEKFLSLAKNPDIFVDKSDLIKEIFDTKSDSLLILRP